MPKINLNVLPDWDSKYVALRDFIYANRKGPWTTGVVTLTDGRSAVCRNPQLATPVHPDATEVAVFCTDTPAGHCPVDWVKSLEIPRLSHN
jgi:hypothetical protein